HRVRGGADAVDRIPLRVVRAAAEADRLHVDGIGSHDAWHDAEQLARASADDRQVVNLLRAQDAFTGARFRLNHFLLRSDSDRLALLTTLAFHVDTARDVRADGDALLLVGLEPRELDLEVVRPREKNGEIAAAIVGDRGHH